MVVGRNRKEPKIEGGPFRIFYHQSLQNIKKLKDPLMKNCFVKKSLTMPKKLKGGPCGIFQHLFCRKTSEN